MLLVVAIAACDGTYTIVGPKQWYCYSDSLKAVRDSFPYCPPDSVRER